ncbi:MAG: IS66 family insertion sequence element accessory protein TnpB [Anaerovoracaceae bacterium]
MVQGYSSQDSFRSGGRRSRESQGGYCGERNSKLLLAVFGEYTYNGGYSNDQWYAHSATEPKLRCLTTACGEFGGFMLSITGLNQFYYLRGFHDMRCKYERVLSIIHQQLNCEPKDGDVFIVMSKDHRLIRLFSYDRRSYSLYERRFVPGYKFMHVEFENDLSVYKINWEDVVLLLESPVIKRLNIR